MMRAVLPILSIWLAVAASLLAQEMPQPLSDAEFEMIVFHSGSRAEWLKIVVMTDKQVEWLVESSGFNEIREAWLDGLISLSDKQAKVLAGFKGNVLELDALDSLTDGQVKSLCKLEAASTKVSPSWLSKDLFWKAIFVSLDGLTSITDEQAKYLSKIDVTDLSLQGISYLSDQQVKSFRNAKAEKLYLDGVESLTDDQLKALAESDIKFGLRGLDKESRSKFKSYGGTLVKWKERPRP